MRQAWDILEMWSTPDAIIRFNGIFYHLWEAGLLWLTCVMILVSTCC